VKRLKRWLLRTVLTAVGLYVVYGVVMIALHTQMIYPFYDRPMSGQRYSAEQIDISGTDPLTLYVGTDSETGPIVLYFMGNVGAFDLFRPSLESHRGKNRTVVAMGYRGGGGLAGEPSETALKRDALLAFDHIRAQNPERTIVVHGYSLGTGLAVHVAARRDVSGVILGAPYDRMCRLMRAASALPACWLPVQRWDTMADADSVRAPVLILHGTADMLIPFASGQRLAEAMKAAGTNVKTVPIPGAGHTNLAKPPVYRNAVNQFFQNL
jgi:pimeloyl-ACP methyl ester carboxylesterase